MSETIEVDSFTAFAHARRGVRADARWIQVEVLGEPRTPRAEACFRLRLGVPPTLVFKSGPRKGQLNWSKRDKSFDREFIVSFVEFDAFVAERKAAKP